MLVPEMWLETTITWKEIEDVLEERERHLVNRVD